MQPSPPSSPYQNPTVSTTFILVGPLCFTFCLHRSTIAICLLPLHFHIYTFQPQPRLSNFRGKHKQHHPNETFDCHHLDETSSSIRSWYKYSKNLKKSMEAKKFPLSINRSTHLSTQLCTFPFFENPCFQFLLVSGATYILLPGSGSKLVCLLWCSIFCDREYKLVAKTIGRGSIEGWSSKMKFKYLFV